MVRAFPLEDIKKAEPLVINRLKRAEQEVNELQCVVEDLYGRLHAVLGESGGACAGGETKPSHSVPLAASLDDIGDGIHGSTERLKSIIRNLEI